jgi:hypothetical protein
MVFSSTLQKSDLVVVVEANAFSSGEFLLELLIDALLILEIIKSLLIAPFELLLCVFHHIAILLP